MAILGGKVGQSGTVVRCLKWRVMILDGGAAFVEVRKNALQERVV